MVVVLEYDFASRCDGYCIWADKSGERAWEIVAEFMQEHGEDDVAKLMQEHAEYDVCNATT